MPTSVFHCYKKWHRQDIFMRGWFATDHEKRWEKFACSVDCISSNWGLSLDWKQVQNSMMQYDSHANFLKNKYDSSHLSTHSVQSWPRKIHFWVAKLSIWHQFYFGILVLNHKLKLMSSCWSELTGIIKERLKDLTLCRNMSRFSSLYNFAQTDAKVNSFHERCLT